jgi:transcriptional regulator with XRE-family HTH domain
MFWENFVILCNQIGKSPNAVCAELKLSNAAATHWKQGAKPNSSTLQKIADYFGVTTEALLTGQKEKAPQDIPEGLSELDAEIIKVFSTLPDEKKQQALSYLEFLHKQGGE